MENKVVSIVFPQEMLRLIDEAAAATYQSRSSFVRMAIVDKFGAKSLFDISTYNAPLMQSDRQTAKMYDFPDEYADI